MAVFFPEALVQKNDVAAQIVIYRAILLFATSADVAERRCIHLLVEWSGDRRMRQFLKKLGTRENSRYALVCFISAVLIYLDVSGFISRPLESSVGGDTVMTISRAIADIAPAEMSDDFLFYDYQNYGFYHNFTTWLFKAFMLLFGDPLGTPYVVFKAVVLLAFFCGWFRLALCVTQSVGASFFFALAVSVAVPGMPGDYWGINSDPQARVQFSAILPFALIVAVKPDLGMGRWVAAFLLMGIGMWLHPASAPPVALALMIAMFSVTWQQRGLARSITPAVAGGLVFMAFAAPNLWLYYQVIGRASIGADPAVVQEALLLRYPAGYIDATGGVWQTISRTFAGPRAVLLLLTVLSVLLVFKRCRTEQRPVLAVLAIFLVSLFLVAGVVPILENYLSQLLGRAPTQFDLIRSLRYMVPMCLLLSFWGICLMVRGGLARAVSSLLLTSGWLLSAYSDPSFPQDRSIVKGLDCWRHGQFLCRQLKHNDLKGLLAFARSTPVGTRFFSPDYGVRIRSFAHRPLSYDWKDIGWLAYSNHRKLGALLPSIRKFVALNKTAPSPERSDRWLAFGAASGADYVALRQRASPSSDPSIVFERPNVVVYRVAKQ